VETLSVKRFIERFRNSALYGSLAPAAAAFEYIAKPHRRRAFGGPLNDQAFRRLIVEGVISACEVRVIVETGSHRGTTTEFFATSGVDRVFTVEYVSRFFWYTRMRLRKHPGVHVLKGDSREALTSIARDHELLAKPTLFYLDAHWDADLPLAEELRIISSHWTKWVAVVDDFRVPGDAGYGFDSYGADATLDDQYCARVGIDGLRIYYPTLESKFESGRRRGCAVLTSVPEIAHRLDGMTALLRPAG
jgi:hypothetical protein